MGVSEKLRAREAFFGGGFPASQHAKLDRVAADLIDSLTRERDDFANRLENRDQMLRDCSCDRRKAERERDEATALSQQWHNKVSEAITRTNAALRERDEARRALTAILKTLIEYRSVIDLAVFEAIKYEIDRAISTGEGVMGVSEELVKELDELDAYMFAKMATYAPDCIGRAARELERLTRELGEAKAKVSDAEEQNIYELRAKADRLTRERNELRDTAEQGLKALQTVERERDEANEQTREVQRAHELLAGGFRAAIEKVERERDEARAVIEQKIDTILNLQSLLGKAQEEHDEQVKAVRHDLLMCRNHQINLRRERDEARRALVEIERRCPATCEITLAHEMADIASAALCATSARELNNKTEGESE